MPVEADHVYLIPPKKEMIISGGRLLLSERDREQELTLPIDVFFRSLAQDCGPRAVAIVLSGGGSDGSRGIRDVHEAGGLVLVQDAESAQFDGMPRDRARRRRRRLRARRREDMPRVLCSSTPSARRRAARADAARDERARHRRRLPHAAGRVRHRLHALQAEHGHPPHRAAPAARARRRHRRVRRAAASSERDELDVLYRDLLIGVTRFFRDEEAFELLEEQRPARAARSACRATRRSASGSPAARPARRRTRSRSCSTS